jgi:hypothetical protein
MVSVYGPRSVRQSINASVDDDLALRALTLAERLRQKFISAIILRFSGAAITVSVHAQVRSALVRSDFLGNQIARVGRFLLRPETAFRLDLVQTAHRQPLTRRSLRGCAAKLPPI